MALWYLTTHISSSSFLMSPPKELVFIPWQHEKCVCIRMYPEHILKTLFWWYILQLRQFYTFWLRKNYKSCKTKRYLLRTHFFIIRGNFSYRKKQHVWLWCQAPWANRTALKPLQRFWNISIQNIFPQLVYC